MSNRRTEIADDKEINELVSKMHSLLPESRRRNTSKASASKLLKETCSYIKSLHREVDNLSGRIADLIPVTDSVDGRRAAEIIRTIFTS